MFASKGPLVARYSELVDLAKQHGARLGASAAVGIPLPSIEVGVLGVRGAGLRRFRGVFNDTANQILRDLESGISLDSAVERARMEGTIEEDPRLESGGMGRCLQALDSGAGHLGPVLVSGEHLDDRCFHDWEEGARRGSFPANENSPHRHRYEAILGTDSIEG